MSVVLVLMVSILSMPGAGVAVMPSVTPTVTPAPTASPPPTLTPVPDLRVFLIMPATYYQPGDDCWLKVRIRNPGPALSSMPLAVALDVHGDLFLWPSWEPYPPVLDFQVVDVPAGDSDVAVLAPFTWPAGAGVATGLRFIASLVSTDLRAPRGKPDTWEFSYGR